MCVSISNLISHPHLYTTPDPLAMDWSRYIKYVVPAVAVSTVVAVVYFSFGTKGDRKIRSNAQLVAYLKEKRHIQSNAVEAAMLKVDRGRYVHGQDEPYEDKAQPIGMISLLLLNHIKCFMKGLTPH